MRNSILPPYLVTGDRAYRSQSSALPTEFQLTSPVLVYRVHPDGKEELVRGAEFGRIGVKLYKEIAALSDDTVVYNYHAFFECVAVPCDRCGASLQP